MLYYVISEKTYFIGITYLSSICKNTIRSNYDYMLMT